MYVYIMCVLMYAGYVDKMVVTMWLCVQCGVTPLP